MTRSLDKYLADCEEDYSAFGITTLEASLALRESRRAEEARLVEKVRRRLQRARDERRARNRAA